jgi:hypothetical protein
MSFIAVRDCQYNGHRFRTGESLPDGWEPSKHFLPEKEARKKINDERMMLLGIRPKEIKAARKAVQSKMDSIKNTADLDMTEDPPLNFLSATEKDFDKYTRAQLAEQIVNQFDVGLNIEGRSKADIIKKGMEIALEKRRNED